MPELNAICNTPHITSSFGENRKVTCLHKWWHSSSSHERFDRLECSHPKYSKMVHVWLHNTRNFLLLCNAHLIDMTKSVMMFMKPPAIAKIWFAVEGFLANLSWFVPKNTDKNNETKQLSLLISDQDFYNLTKTIYPVSLANSPHWITSVPGLCRVCVCVYLCKVKSHVMCKIQTLRAAPAIKKSLKMRYGSKVFWTTWLESDLVTVAAAAAAREL